MGDHMTRAEGMNIGHVLAAGICFVMLCISAWAILGVRRRRRLHREHMARYDAQEPKA